MRSSAGLPFMTESGRLEGVVLVTGGTGGLGQAVVSELLDAGAQVVAPWLVGARARRHSRLLWAIATASRWSRRTCSREGADAAVAAAKERGELRAVVNLVGGFAAGGRIHENAPEQFDKMLALNLTTALNSSRAAIPELLADGGGAIVCVGTKVALRALQRRGRLRDLEVGGAGPGPVPRCGVPRGRDPRERHRPNIIDTPANRESMPDADHSKWVQPAEIARVIRFLCSEDSAPVTGAAIPVYGQTG